MIRIIVGLALIFLMIGCASKQLTPKIIIKEVPKIIYKLPPAPPLIRAPALPINMLNITSSNGDIAKAYVATVELYKVYVLKLKLALAPYKRASEVNE